MRQLSDLLVYAPFCRIRACRRAERCRGGAGPPCLYEATPVFVGPIADGMRDIRRFWARQRRLAAEMQAATAKEALPRAGETAPGEGAGPPRNAAMRPRSTRKDST